MKDVISVRSLRSKVDSFGGSGDTRAAREDLKRSDAKELRVHEIPVSEVLDIWQVRAERAKARGEYFADMQLLVDRLTAGLFSTAGQVFVSIGDHSTVYFLDPRLSDIIAIIRRPTSEGPLDH